MEEIPIIGLTIGQLLALAGLGLVLLVGLLILKQALKMTKTVLKIGCVAIFVLFLAACVALQALGQVG